MFYELGIAVLVLVGVYVLTSFFIAFGFSLKGKGVPSTIPAKYDIIYEDVSFESSIDHVVLRGWYIPGSGSTNTTIILMHGGKAHRADESMGLLEICVGLTKQGFNILTIDRRGCGLSDSPKFYNRGHLERDFEGAVNYIQSRNGHQEKIFLFGNSIGALAALACVRSHQEDGIIGIIADSVFATRKSIAVRVLNTGLKFGGIFAPGALFFGELIFGLPKLDAIDIVGNISAPILFINGDKDLQIPVEAVYQLKDASVNPSDEIYIVSGAAHSKTFKTSPAEYINRVVSFINDNLDS